MERSPGRLEPNDPCVHGADVQADADLQRRAVGRRDVLHRVQHGGGKLRAGIESRRLVSGLCPAAGVVRMPQVVQGPLA